MMLNRMTAASLLCIAAGLLIQPSVASSRETGADKMRTEAAADLVRRLNQRMERPISVVVDLSDDSGHRIGSMVAGPEPTQRPAAIVCRSYATAGEDQSVGVHDRRASWAAEPLLARAAFQHDIVADIFSCLQAVGFDEAAAGGTAVSLAKYDSDVRMGQLVGATVLLDMLAGVDLTPARIERAEMADDAKTDPEAVPQASIMAAALKAVSQLGKSPTYAQVAERAGDLSAVAYGFSAAGPAHWTAPDGLVIAVSPSSREFGWDVVPGGEGTEYLRRFTDPRSGDVEGPRVAAKGIEGPKTP